MRGWASPLSTSVKTLFDLNDEPLQGPDVVWLMSSRCSKSSVGFLRAVTKWTAGRVGRGEAKEEGVWVISKVDRFITRDSNILTSASSESLVIPFCPATPHCCSTPRDHSHRCHPHILTSSCLRHRKVSLCYAIVQEPSSVKV